MSEPAYRGPEEVLGRWQQAVGKGDFATYLGCLQSSQQKADAQGTREAMREWRDVLAAWRNAGFSGTFKFVLIPGKQPDAPQAVLAFPLLGNQQLGRPARLCTEAGVWRIESLPVH